MQTLSNTQAAKSFDGLKALAALAAERQGGSTVAAKNPGRQWTWTWPF